MHHAPFSSACQGLTSNAFDLVLLIWTVSLDMVEAFAFEALLDSFAAFAIVKSETIGALNDGDQQSFFLECGTARGMSQGLPET